MVSAGLGAQNNFRPALLMVCRRNPKRADPNWNIHLKPYTLKALYSGIQRMAQEPGPLSRERLAFRRTKGYKGGHVRFGSVATAWKFLYGKFEICMRAGGFKL